MSSTLPIFYSFRRCPYAMRARLALSVSGQAHEHREILLSDKPAAMLSASPKGTVPVLVLPDGQVIDESLDIMLWALYRHDPEHWLQPEQGDISDMRALIMQCDGPFKQALDAYKYARDPKAKEPPRALAADLVAQWEHRLTANALLSNAFLSNAFLFGKSFALADAAILPFVRQFAAVEPAWFARQPWPRLQRWLADITNSARFENVMQKHEIWRKSE